jgi:uncharacterized membrane protein
MIKRLFLIPMILFYILAGANHFWHPRPYLQIMPPWLPWQKGLVYVSGFLEIFLGVLLIPRITRHWGAWGIIVLLIAVFPANIQMAIDYGRSHQPYFWLTLVRLPVQALLIGLAWQYTR